MQQRIDGLEESNRLQNHFTAYLIKAIQRQKKDYMNKKKRLLEHEVSDDFLKVFARVLERRTYDELAQKLSLRYKGVSTAYYRVIQKLRRKLRGDKT